MVENVGKAAASDKNPLPHHTFTVLSDIFKPNAACGSSAHRLGAALRPVCQSVCSGPNGRWHLGLEKP